MPTIAETAHGKMPMFDFKIPVDPRDNWEHAYKTIYGMARMDAQAGGVTEKLDDVPGALLEKAIGSYVDYLWPSLSNYELRNIRASIASGLTARGSAKCIEKGHWKAGRKPVWFIPDEYGALPMKPKNNKKRNRKAKAKATTQAEADVAIAPDPMPEADVDVEYEKDKARIENAATLTIGLAAVAKRSAYQYARALLGADAKAMDVRRWLADHGVKMSDAYCHHLFSSLPHPDSESLSPPPETLTLGEPVEVPVLEVPVQDITDALITAPPAEFTIGEPTEPFIPDDEDEPMDIIEMSEHFELSDSERDTMRTEIEGLRKRLRNAQDEAYDLRKQLAAANAMLHAYADIVSK